MRQLHVGESFHPGVTGFEEGIHYNYTPFGHALTLSIRQPSQSEIDAVREGLSAFALIVSGPVVFVLSRFSDRPWQAAAYNWWINPPAMRPDPRADLLALNGAITLNVCLVDAATGIVKALREVRLSHEFASKLLGRIDLQTHQPFNPWEYLEKLRDAKAKYQDAQRVVAEALCLCTANPKSTRSLLTPVPLVVQQ